MRLIEGKALISEGVLNSLSKEEKILGVLTKFVLEVYFSNMQS